MAANENDKFIIYKGNDNDYAFIPLKFECETSYDFTNGIIANDGSTYIKNLNNKELTESVKKYIIDNKALILGTTISIKDSETYKIKDYNINNKMLLFDISLYYIENFKYRLDTSQYYVEDNENGSAQNRGDTYMFTITPDFIYDIKNISIGVPASLPPDSGGSGDSGETGGNTGDDSENKKYNIIFSISNTTSLSLLRIDATNNYKLTGTLILEYNLDNKEIKGDEGTLVSLNLAYPTFNIVIGNKEQKFNLNQRISNGYDSSLQLWKGNITLDISTYNLTYTLTPGSNYQNNVIKILLSKSAPIFTNIGNKLDNYKGKDQSTDSLNIYTFNLLNMNASDEITSNAYFLQSQLNGYYATWNAVVSAVKGADTTTRKVSGIFIIITDSTTILPILSVISSATSVSQPSFNSNYFKYNSTGNNSIFTAISSSNTELDGPPIFLYDENNKQIKISSYERDINIFNNESYFTYKSGNKFNVSDTSNKYKNIINLNNYRNIMYEYSDDIRTHYCGTNLGYNANLSKYEGKTFHVVFELWISRKELIENNNDLIINNNNSLALKAMSPTYLPIDKIDDGTTIINPTQSRWVRKVTMYELYSFKLSKTDSSTGVYEYTYNG